MDLIDRLRDDREPAADSALRHDAANEIVMLRKRVRELDRQVMMLIAQMEDDAFPIAFGGPGPAGDRVDRGIILPLAALIASVGVGLWLLVLLINDAGAP